MGGAQNQGAVDVSISGSHSRGEIAMGRRLRQCGLFLAGEEISSKVKSPRFSYVRGRDTR